MKNINGFKKKIDEGKCNWFDVKTMVTIIIMKIQIKSTKAEQKTLFEG